MGAAEGAAPSSAPFQRETFFQRGLSLVGASSWDVVAGDQTGVDFIPMKRSSK